MPLMPAVDQWTYTAPDASDKDTVRFWLQDTDPALRLLSDAEITYLINTWKPKYDSLVYVAAKAAEVISVKFAGVVTVSADGVTVNTADLQERYNLVARRLYQAHKDIQVGGEIDISNLLWGSHRDHGIDPLVFGMGLHDNREAGRQDYGGERFNPWAYADEVTGGY